MPPIKRTAHADHTATRARTLNELRLYIFSAERQKKKRQKSPTLKEIKDALTESASRAAGAAAESSPAGPKRGGGVPARPPRLPPPRSPAPPAPPPPVLLSLCPSFFPPVPVPCRGSSLAASPGSSSLPPSKEAKPKNLVGDTPAPFASFQPPPRSVRGGGGPRPRKGSAAGRPLPAPGAAGSQEPGIAAGHPPTSPSSRGRSQPFRLCSFCRHNLLRPGSAKPQEPSCLGQSPEDVAMGWDLASAISSFCCLVCKLSVGWRLRRDAEWGAPGGEAPAWLGSSKCSVIAG
ncbi:uncharacterized protein LOC142059554 [Phalacrocorax aristotelis]|uniref:uncharacterized protein LOC142059554 n=1 Tax=Phalacrocorax aristotelis TaxID=126867 RepID=UPI003F4C5E00